MKDVTQNLINARKIIESPENWTQGQYAANENQEEVDWEDTQATCFCTIGAIRKGKNKIDFEEEEYYIFSKATNIYNIPGWNDNPNRTHAEVLEAFDKAIEYSKTC